MRELKEYPIIDTENCLEIDVLSLKKVNNHINVAELNSIRVALKVLKDSGKIRDDDVLYRSIDDYSMLLNWLAGKSRMHFSYGGNSIDQLSVELESTPEDIIERFNNSVKNFDNRLSSSTTYRQYEATAAFIEPAIDDIVESGIGSIQKEKGASLESIEQRLADGIKEIKQATTIYQFNSWADHYETMVKDLDNKVNGIKPERYHIWSYIKSYRFHRLFWFIFLALTVIFACLDKVFFHLLNKETSMQATDTIKVLSQYVVYTPLIIIASIEYSFAIKNYRIYSNMLDQYKHRKIVASTMVGILGSSKETLDDQQRNLMVAVAAQALFEQKNTGHLSKREAESSGVSEMVKLMLGSKY